jgi:hypothetical protein
MEPAVAPLAPKPPAATLAETAEAAIEAVDAAPVVLAGRPAAGAPAPEASPARAGAQ